MNEGTRKACPAFEVLAALHEGTLPAAEAATAQQHLRDCPSCRTEFAMLRDFAAARPAAGEAADVAHIVSRLRAAPTRKRSWWAFPAFPRWAAAAAAMAVVVVAAIELQPWRSRDLPQLESTGTLRSGTVIDLSPRGDVATVPTRFSWTTVPDAVQYEVAVSEVDGTGLWRARSALSHLDVPPAVSTAFLPSKTLVVQVTAFDRSGVRLAQSGPARIRYLRK